MSNETEPTIAELEADLAALRFPSFDQGVAFRLGTVAVQLIQERDLPVAVQIIFGDQIVFTAALNGAAPATADWLRRKSRTALLDAESSLLIKRRIEQGAPDLAARGLDENEYAAYGGSFPLIVGNDAVGTLTVSGAADTVDHDLATAAIRRFLSA